MRRTQIYLPQRQLTALKERAHKKTVTVSEVIRSILEERLALRPSQRSTHHETLMDAAQRINRSRSKGPRDLASHVDQYLYGN